MTPRVKAGDASQFRRRRSRCALTFAGFWTSEAGAVCRVRSSRNRGDVLVHWVRLLIPRIQDRDRGVVHMASTARMLPFASTMLTVAILPVWKVVGV